MSHIKREIDRSFWPDDPSLEGLLFFAEKICELSSIYTIDSYKAPALNLRIGILEIVKIAEMTLDREIRPQLIEGIVSELRQKIKDDPVITTERAGLLTEYLKDFTSDPGKQKPFIGLAMASELDRFYWSELCAKLRQVVMSPARKKEISDLATTFVIEAEYRNYSRTHIFHVASSMFFSNCSALNPINSPNQINEFLEQFENSQNEWTVIVRGGNKFQKVAALLAGIRVVESFGKDLVTELNPPSELFNFNETHPLYVILTKVPAPDARTAREEAIRLLTKFAGICHFHHNNSVLLWSENIYVKSKNEKNWNLLKSPPSITTSNKWLFQHMPLENTMEVFFGEFHLNKDSSVRFQKAVMFHYASQSIESSEQRLTGMWTLLESLLPRHPAYHATSMITPALILIYFEKLLRYTWLTLRECPKQVRRLIKKIDVGGNHLEKLAAILSCEEYEDERIKLCEMLSRFPLRRNSLFELHKILGDPKQMSRILCQHEQRITHHLYRIYSSRNFITHQASSLPYTESIVEHLHHYIDVLMFSIIEIAVTGDEPISIEQILAQLKAYSSNHVKMLATETTKSNKENYLRYVFGVNNPLSVMNRRSHKRKEFIFPFGKWDNVEND